MTGFDATVIAGLAAILSVGMFFINSVTASYNIGGTIEGFVDPKFKRIPTGILACAIVSLVAAIFMVLMIGGI
jgi:tetrahydromethanopterin S-methyltransferase subunit D